jgi:hypothetical protein
MHNNIQGLSDEVVAAHPGCIRVRHIIFATGALMCKLNKELEGIGYPLRLHRYLQKLVDHVASPHAVTGAPELVPVSNVSTWMEAHDAFAHLQLPPAAPTSSDMPPPPPAGSRSYSRYRHTFAATQGFTRQSASLSEAQRDRSRSSPCLPPPPAPPAPGSSAVTFDPHRRGVSSVPSRGRAISVPPSPPSTAPGSPPSTAASKRKSDHAPWNDPRVPVTPAASATPADPPPWQSLKRPRCDGSVRTARTVSPQPRPD